ncbi:MAG: lytic murein transglycosylase [Cypionkella sp.]|nr:lytic murein transglycosylase [Cypionkella sp.]
MAGGAASPRAASRWHGQANPAFDAWAQGFAARARAKGLPETIVSRAMASAQFIPEVIERDRNQTEVQRSLEDYLNIAASAERVTQGRAALARMSGPLRAIESRYGVPANVVAAVWGLESFYGTRMGDVPVISALSTLAYDGRRGAFFESQLIAALRILAAGDITQDRMLGSWAGAMGHTQFIPTSYLGFAVDFTGDGRRDIWGGDPTDALASTAAYLAKSGWRKGQPWGEEVATPASAAAGTRDTGAWAALGVTGIGGGRLRGSGPAQLLRPAGAGGPALLLYGNTRVILRYNNALSYAVGVGHLSDRLAGAGPLRAAFPPDSAGMTQDQRAELQRLLAAQGYDAGNPDGVIGKGTEAAIAAYQSANGLPVTGRPSLDLLARLR